VSGASGALPPGPPPAAQGAGASPLRLAGAGAVRVTLLGARGSWCDGDLLLLTPQVAPAPGTADPTLPSGARRLWVGYLRHLGEAVDLGPYPAGTELVLGLAPGGACAGAAPRPSSGPAARVAHPAPGVWDLWWEDLRADETADHDDLVVRVEALPTTP
jgi:hypothetical protein